MDELASDIRIISAARLGEAFSIDPLQVLDVPFHDWLIRIAAAKALSKDRAEQERKRRGTTGGY